MDSGLTGMRALVTAVNSSREPSRIGSGSTTGVAPVSHTAWSEVTSSGVVGPSTATCSPWVMPRAWSAPAMARAFSCSSPHDMVSGSGPVTKVIRPSPLAACSISTGSTG